MNSYDDTTTPTGDPATVVPADLLQRILTDAAQRTGAPRSSVRAVGAAARRWSDGALGCREPDLYYTQALEDGFMVVVTAGDTLLDYRTGGTRHFRVCPPDTRADD